MSQFMLDYYQQNHTNFSLAEHTKFLIDIDIALSLKEIKHEM